MRILFNKIPSKPDSDFTIQYEISVFKLIHEIEQYNTKKYNPEHTSTLLLLISPLNFETHIVCHSTQILL